MPRYVWGKLWASTSPVTMMNAGWRNVNGNCCMADLSSHQFVSEPYRLKVLGCVRSRIDSHWAGSAACNSFTNIGSAIGLKCRSDIQRNFDSLGGALACAASESKSSGINRLFDMCVIYPRNVFGHHTQSLR